MAFVTVSAPFEQVGMPALDLRRFLATIVTAEGVRGGGDLVASQRAAGADMSVDLAFGYALVQGDSVVGQGYYHVFNNAAYNLTGFAAAHATLPRVDRVVLRARDMFHGDAANDVAPLILTGTATAGATLANLTGAAAVANNQLLIANVLMPAAAVSITTANIADVRPRLLLTAGEITYGEITASVTVSGTTEAAANTVITSTGATYDGSSVMVEFYSPYVAPAAAAGASVNLILFEDATSRGRVAIVQTPTAAASSGIPVTVSRRLSPAAGAHTFTVKAYQAFGNGEVRAGVGGAGPVDVPAYLRITRA